METLEMRRLKLPHTRRTGIIAYKTEMEERGKPGQQKCFNEVMSDTLMVSDSQTTGKKEGERL